MDDKALKKEVIEALTQDPQQIAFESIPEESGSPLNQKVKEKNLLDQNTEEKNWNIWKPKAEPTQKTQDIEMLEDKPQTPPTSTYETDDAPQQDFAESTTNPNTTGAEDSFKQSIDSEATFELPTATAKQAADTILGMSNNVLAVGGGLFVKIKKHQDFYEFEEVVELIDSQNEKNVQRIKLDKEDKALLRPLLVEILKKKAKKLTPEQQLIGAVLSIVMKKAQVVMEIRAENEILVDRILDIVRQERKEEVIETSDGAVREENEPEIPEMDFTRMQKDAAIAIEQVENQEVENGPFEDVEDLYADVVEVIDENPNS